MLLLATTVCATCHTKHDRDSLRKHHPYIPFTVFLNTNTVRSLMRKIYEEEETERDLQDAAAKKAVAACTKKLQRVTSRGI